MEQDPTLQVLALIIAYIGSVAIPVLAFVGVQLTRLSDLHRECEDLRSKIMLEGSNKFFEKAMGKSENKLETCKALTLDCDDISKERKHTLKVSLIVIFYGIFYIAFATRDLVPTNLGELIPVLVFASIFPAFAVYYVHEQMDNYVKELSLLRNLVEKYYNEKSNHDTYKSHYK